MLLLREIFFRLELFVKDCPDYSRRWDRLLALAGAYGAFATWLFFFVYLVIVKDPDTVALGVGMFAVGGVVWALQGGPAAYGSDVACQLERSSVPAEEAALVTFVATFYILYEWHQPIRTADRMRPDATVTHVALALVYCGLSLWGPWYLSLHSFTSLLGGAAVGLLGASFAFLCLTLYPHRRRLQRVAQLCCCLEPQQRVRPHRSVVPPLGNRGPA